MDDKKRVGFLGAVKNMFVGVAKPEAYYRNGRFGRMSSAMLITFIMSTLTYLVIFFIPYNQLFGGGRFADRIDRNMEDFSLTGDGFYYDGTFDWSDDENMSYIKIDTSKTKVDEAVARDLAADGGYRTVFIISADEILTYNSGRTQIIRCKDIYESLNETYGFKAVTKQDVINLINKLDTPVLVLAWVLQIIVGFVLTLFWSLLITVAGLIAASMKKIEVSFGTIYKSAIYIRLLWYFLMMVIATYIWPAKRTMGMLALFISVIYIFAAVSQYHKNNPDDDPQEDPAQVEQNDLAQEFSQYEQR